MNDLYGFARHPITSNNFLFAATIFGFKEATMEDLMTKRGIIYLIQNQYDLKGYLGKSINTFCERYTMGKWWQYSVNKPLLRTLAYQPPEGFKIFILEWNIQYYQVLDRHEKFWAGFLNTYAPNGYNIRECGQGGEFYGEGRFIKQKSIEKLRKTYHLKQVSDGELFTITYLDEWCKQMGLKSGHIRNVLCGLVSQSQGFCLPGAILPDKPNNCLVYKVRKIDTGEIIIIDYVVGFCKQNGLNPKSF